jgi:AraC-like DNA-binding protein
VKVMECSSTGMDCGFVARGENEDQVMSERSLQRDFQREVGMTIGQWRQQLRILVALEKLTAGLSVTDTCFAVGYNNVSAFIKAFKRSVGVTPLEYVKNQRSSPQPAGPLLMEFH